MKTKMKILSMKIGQEKYKKKKKKNSTRPKENTPGP